MGETRRSVSAEVVAAERALLHDMGVVDDPHAHDMLGPMVRTALRIARRAPDRVPTLPVTLAGLAGRILWHDQRVVESTRERVDQVVILGAGFDSRAWRLAADGVQFFEVDHIATQAVKIQRAPEGGPAYVPADLAHDRVAEGLADAGLDLKRPAMLVLEGVTMYLAEDDLRVQLTDLATACAQGSRLSVDFYPPADAGSATNQRHHRWQRAALRTGGEGLKLLADRPEAVALVEATGWSVAAATGARDASAALIPQPSDLPITAVNNHKSLVLATRG